jgi:hypothetical protein
MSSSGMIRPSLNLAKLQMGDGASKKCGDSIILGTLGIHAAQFCVSYFGLRKRGDCTLDMLVTHDVFSDEHSDVILVVVDS